MNAPIRHVLIDIEGTTCPVRFVSETLFPYAAERLEAFLNHHQDDEAVQDLLVQVAQAWKEDRDPSAHSLLQAAPANPSPASRILPYLQWLIREDRKLTPLKDLQGMVWEEGYRLGDLQGPLYPDVAPALHRWREGGLGLAVYSSGSVKAQQLLYAHSNAGDLRPLFQHWFDTKLGSKLEPESYRLITGHLDAPPQAVLFISDSPDELKAASASGLSVLLCDRSDSPNNSPNSEGFTKIHSFYGLNPLDQTSLEGTLPKLIL